MGKEKYARNESPKLLSVFIDGPDSVAKVAHGVKYTRFCAKEIMASCA